jgi:competence protein ComEC
VPLLAAALCFAVGICLAQPSGHFRPAVTLFAATLVLLALTALSLRRAPHCALLPVLALWILTGFWSAEIEPAPPSQAALEPFVDGLSRTVEGHIVRIRELPPRATAATASNPADLDPDPDSDQDEAAWEEAEAPPILSFDLDLTALEQVTPDRSRLVPATGGLRLTVLSDGPAPTLHCGDLIQVPARLRTPERYRDPGAWQYADTLASQGIGAQASVRASRLTVTPDRGGPSPRSQRDLRCALYRAQSWAARSLTGFVLSPANRSLPHLLRLTPDDAGMLNAMLFGDRDRLSHALRLGFERTGSFHLFVVSGMHVALLAGALFWLARRLRLPPIAATLLTVALTTAYALLTGFGAPVQRALLMSSILLGARLLRRTGSVLNALGAALLGVLLLAPSSLFEAGFQMTFLAIVAIAGIALPLGEWSFLPYAHAARNLDAVWNDRALAPPLAQFRVQLRLWGEHLEALAKALTAALPSILPPKLALTATKRARHLPAACLRAALWLLELVLIGLVAELVMALPMAVYFHRATLFALPANMLSVPLVALLAPLAVVTFLLSLLSPWLATLPAAATALLLHGITATIAHVGHLHGADWRVPAPPLAIALIALLGWILCCWAVRQPDRRHGARWALAAAALLPLLTALILFPYPQIATPNTLEVTAIDVGQGDSLLLVTPEGRTLLIDAGGPVGRAGSLSNPQAAAFDVGEEVVSPYLWSRRIRRLDVVALTHAHSDHMGGMPAILRNFRPRELWVGIDPASTAYASLLHQAADLHILVRHLHAGDTPLWPDTPSLSLRVLAPAITYANQGPPVNNDSLVLHVQYGLSSVLLEGDAEAPSERAMLAAHAITPVTLLKVGHHGSRTSTTPDFFAAAAPRDAVISVGRRNTFGHPRAEILVRIAQAHTRLYRTDVFGLTRFLLTPTGDITESDNQPQ